MNPNRVDCMGVYGVAREVHAITGAELAPAPWDDDAEADGGGEASATRLGDGRGPGPLPAVHRARLHRRRRSGPSPLWLKARLIAAGQRPISNVVDITNYVMLMTAQPLHAFDLDRVPGGEIIVRSAREGERMTTLDGVERSFDAETVLVCDRDGPDRDRRDHGRPGLRGLRRDDPGAARGRDLERPQHPADLEQARRCAPRRRRGSRSSSTRSSRSGPSGSPRGCWSSSAARGWCPARSTSPPRSRRPPDHAARRRAPSRCSAIAIEPDESAPHLEPARLRGREPRAMT